MPTNTAGEARAKVTRVLSGANVYFTASNRGSKRDVFGDGSTNVMDVWGCAFAVGERGPAVEFDFYTGIGLRKAPEWAYGVAGFDRGPPPRVGSMLHAQWLEQAKPQPPHAADLLHSLLSDASACEQSFESWCNEIGYDTDSRKAHATYLACQANGDKLRKVFNAEQIRQISEALTDY